MTLVEAAWLDVRYARRVLVRTPGFTITALLTLALAIGINTAVFAIVNAVLLKPLPYPRPDRLMLVSTTFRQDGRVSENLSVNGRTWELVRDHAPSVQRAVFRDSASGVNLVARGANGSEQARFVQQQRVSAGFFDVLGVAPRVGRGFTPDEDRAGGPAAVVLSAGLWRAVLASDPSIIGQSIMLRGEPHTVVGIMPDGFRTAVDADLWTPLRPSTTGEGGGTNYQILIRMGEDVALDQAAAQMAGVGSELQRRRPSGSPGEVSLSLVGLQQGMTESVRPSLLIVGASVVVVLLAACVNLAGLMLTRASRRRTEIATRLALGSGRAAVIRQLIVEAAVLGVSGGVAGVGVALVAVRGLAWLARDTFGLWQPATIGGREAMVAGLLAIIGSLIFGLGPAIQASRYSSSLGAPTRSVAGHASHWPRRILVVAQVALVVLLLIGSGLLLRTFGHLRGLDPGFEAEHVVTAAVSLEDARYRAGSQVALLMDATLARLRQEPGIEAAAVGLGLPYQRLLNMPFRRVDGTGAATPNNRITNATYVSSDFFTTLRIPVRRGRSFDARDRAGTAPVIVVNEAMVREHFKDEDPIGRRLRMSDTALEIVGVVGDVQTRPGWGNSGPLSTSPLIYLPIDQVSDGFVRLVHTWFMPTFVVRSQLPAEQAAGSIRRAVAATDPMLPLVSVQSMVEVRASSLEQQRLLATLLLSLAIAALLVATIGIHGLIAASVTERTREMGIRLALGSTLGQALTTLALPGVVLAAIGTVVGLVGSLAAVPLVRHFVWGVGVHDPLTYGGVSLVLLLVAAVASLVPALRILRLDPATTLRDS